MHGVGDLKRTPSVLTPVAEHKKFHCSCDGLRTYMAVDDPIETLERRNYLMRKVASPRIPATMIKC